MPAGFISPRNITGDVYAAGVSAILQDSVDFQVVSMHVS